MNPIYRNFVERTLTQRRRVRFEPMIIPRYSTHAADGTILWQDVGGYREPRPSELRHHWHRNPFSGVVMCSRCCLEMDRPRWTWRCFGAGRP